MNDWQPINTAPTDKKILLWAARSFTRSVGEVYYGYVNVDYQNHPHYKYSHWMPLPEPPKEK